jgi:hypothetical protein
MRLNAAVVVVTASAEPATVTDAGAAAGTATGAAAETAAEGRGRGPARDPAFPGAAPAVCRCGVAAAVRAATRQPRPWPPGLRPPRGRQPEPPSPSVSRRLS